VFLPDEVARLHGNSLAAVFYVANWYLVSHHESYFETAGRPSLFQHVWSLGIEEQFYLLWPPLFIAGMRRMRYLPMTLAVLMGAARLNCSDSVALPA
jgi:peptidoglycan/LPS O-acetylase OafA/YrhL